MSIEELYNILLSDKPSNEILKNENKIFILIPELKKCKGFNQNNEWHIYDVYEHILHVVDNVPNNIILRLAALFHDIGKPISYTQDENGIGHFYGHWEESKKIFCSFAIKNNLDENMTDLISKIIYYHDVNIDKLDDKQIQKLCNTFNIEEIKMLYQLKRADLLSQNKKYHYILEKYNDQEKELLFKYKERK